MYPQKKKVIFFGDSITQMGAGPGGFIDLLEKKLTEGKDAGKWELIGAGISANKVYDLYLRMDKDVLEKKPDIVVIWIGVNDVWHKTSLGTGTDADKFEKFYSALIQTMQARGIQLVLATPAVIGEQYDGSNAQDKDMDLYAAIVKKLAENYHCQLCDLRQLFIQYERNNNLQNKPAGILTVDGVHLNEAGNALVADAIYKSLKQLITYE
jgi:lysophospholipase L1-like esterase